MFSPSRGMIARRKPMVKWKRTTVVAVGSGAVYRSKTEAEGSFTKPSGTVDGDILIGSFVNEQGDQPGVPSGWVSLWTKDVAGFVYWSVGYREADSEPSSYSTANAEDFGFILCYKDTSGYHDSGSTSVAEDTTTTTAPAVVSTVANCLPIRLAFLYPEATSMSAPNVTERSEYQPVTSLLWGADDDSVQAIGPGSTKLISAGEMVTNIASGTILVKPTGV